MKIHELKCYPEYYQALIDGTKTFEVRVNDRNFQIGDWINFHEYNPKTEEYTGRSSDGRKIIYMVKGIFGLPENICVMQLSKK